MSFYSEYVRLYTYIHTYMGQGQTAAAAGGGGGIVVGGRE
jgi:hypothetical protein